MRKIALSSLALVATLYAGSDIKKFEVTPTIGFNMFDSDSHMKDDSLFGVRGTFNLDKYYGIRVGYEGAFDAGYSKELETLALDFGNNTSSSSTSNATTTDVHRFLGEVVVSGDEEYNVIPYVFLGLGYEMLSDETKHDVSQGLLDIGLGFKYQVWKDINVMLESKAVRKFDTHDIDTIFTLGVGYIFGQSLINPNNRYDDRLNTTKLNVPFEKNQPKQVLFEPIQERTTQQDSTQKLDKFLKDEAVSSVEYKPVLKSARYEDTSVEEVQAIDGGMIQESDFVEASGETTLDDILGVTSSASVVQSAPATFTKIDDAQTVGGVKQYYVKFATLFGNGSAKSLMRKIENKNYQAHEINSVLRGKSVRYIVAGPFNDKAEANSALSSLKFIKKGAYITKL